MSITLSRKDLYDRVWAEPIHTLSKAYGLSDVGLAKICRRFGVPVPPRGHWARKQAGKRVSQPPLPPEPPKGCGDVITLPSPAPKRSADLSAPEAPPHPLIAAEADPSNAILVPEGLQVRHPLLRGTKDFWRWLKRRDFDWQAPRPPHVNMNVGKAAQPRALRLLQALFAALERRGHAVGSDIGNEMV